MRILLGIWRVIRWIIYLVLLLLLPIAVTFSVGWIQNGNEPFAVQFKTDLIKLNYNLSVVKVPVSDGEKIEQVLVDGKESSIIVSLWGVGVSYYQEEGDAALITVGTDSATLGDHSINSDNIIAVEGTYLLGGSLVLYIILLIVMLIHIHKRRKKDNPLLKIAQEREAISSPEDLNIPIETEPQVFEEVVEVNEAIEISHDDELFTSVSDEEAIDDLDIEPEKVDEVEFHEEEKGIIISREENKEKIDSYKYVDEVKKAKEKESLVDIETKWCKILAEQGDKEAQYALAVCYAIGYKDIERSEILSHYWLKKSADNGYEKAIEMLR